MRFSGWFQAAYERELEKGVTPVRFFEERLMVVEAAGGLKACDAICPHRGANLAYGGEVEDGAVICPFHGYRVKLGGQGEGFSVAEYRSFLCGGLVFANLDADRDHGFEEFLRGLDSNHYVVPGFTMKTTAPAQLVIENAFDAAHFRTVHGILNEPRLTPSRGAHGEYWVEGTFTIPPSPWQKLAPGQDRLDVRYVARAFSPWIVVSVLQGPNPYYVITCATPSGNETTVRLSLIMPPDENGAAPSQTSCQYLLKQSRQGLEKDQVIWDNLRPDRVPRWTGADESVIGFRRFVETFREERA